MSDEHKAALARGREEGRAVRRYLEALEEQRPRRGRRRTPDSIQRRLSVIEEKLETADPLSRLHLRQEQANLEAELEHADGGDDLDDLEEQFIAVAASYGDRKGISYSAWRSAGVSPQTLQRAGIRRSARTA